MLTFEGCCFDGWVPLDWWSRFDGFLLVGSIYLDFLEAGLDELSCIGVDFRDRGISTNDDKWVL